MPYPNFPRNMCFCLSSTPLLARRGHSSFPRPLLLLRHVIDRPGLPSLLGIRKDDYAGALVHGENLCVDVAAAVRAEESAIAGLRKVRLPRNGADADFSALLLTWVWSRKT